MNKDEDRNCFYVSDLPLVATLVFLGFQFLELDASNPARSVFKFPANKEIDNAVTSYWQGKLFVEPKSFCNIQRELKARLRSMQK